MRRNALLAGLALLLLAAGLPRLELIGGLEALLPEADPQVEAGLALIRAQGGDRRLVIELGGDETALADVAGPFLEHLRRRLEPLGLRPAALARPAAWAAAAALAEERLPVLLTPEELEAALAERCSPDWLGSRMRSLRLRAESGEDLLGASAVAREPLALGELALGPLAGLRQGSELRHGALLHADRRHLLLLLETAFPPGDADAGDQVALALSRAAGEAQARGLHLAWSGPLRHHRDNRRQIASDLLASLPLAGLAILGLLTWLLGWRGALAAHLPAVCALAGGGGLLGWLGSPVHPAVLGFAAGMLGLAVDYGTHQLAARRAGASATARAPLFTAWATTAAGFAALGCSSVPALHQLGLLVASGLGCGLLATLALLPLLPVPLPSRDRWAGAGFLLGCVRHPRRCHLLALLLSAALLPGLFRLGWEDDPRRFDAAGAQTRDDEQAILARWGRWSGSEMLVLRGPDSATALTRLEEARHALGLPPALAWRLLPPPEEQARRRAAWDAAWERWRERLASALSEAAAAHGLRAAGLSLQRYGSASGCTIALGDWAGTPAEALLAGRLLPLATDWLAAEPLPPDFDRPLPTGALRLAPLALGRAVQDALATDLWRSTLTALLLVALALLVCERGLLRLGVRLAAPLLALGWTLGLLGWSSVALGPFALLSAAFVLGAGVDTAVFLAGPHRRHAFSPVLASTATSLVGVACLGLAGHPAIRQMGLVLGIGMLASLLAALLLLPRPAAGTTEPP